MVGKCSIHASNTGRWVTIKVISNAYVGYDDHYRADDIGPP